MSTTDILETEGQADDAAAQLERDFTRIVREEIGMGEGEASEFAQALVRGLRRLWGGEELYIPAPDRRARDAAIRREFMGTNAEEVMRRHGIKRSRLYEIVGQRPLRHGVGVCAAASPPDLSLSCSTEACRR